MRFLADLSAAGSCQGNGRLLARGRGRADFPDFHLPLHDLSFLCDHYMGCSIGGEVFPLNRAWGVLHLPSSWAFRTDGPAQVADGCRKCRDTLHRDVQMRYAPDFLRLVRN